MGYSLEIEQEDDGRWIADVPEIPGVLVYAGSRNEAIARAQALSLRVLAERLENGEQLPEIDGVFRIIA
ncbi:MAG: type II toxin-antitoxin system HicB family antitoxin [Dongiaceae bacterium]